MSLSYEHIIKHKQLGAYQEKKITNVPRKYIIKLIRHFLENEKNWVLQLLPTGPCELHFVTSGFLRDLIQMDRDILTLIDHENL